MHKRSTHTVPVRMGTIKRRFEQWRRTRKGHGRIPETLWAMAVASAKEHGASKTAHTLSLDYTGLKKRMEARCSRVSSANKEALKFVELPMPPASDCPECTVEVEDAQGSKLRIQFKGGATTDLLALSRALWSHER